jgi:hypothetical protein
MDGLKALCPARKPPIGAYRYSGPTPDVNAMSRNPTGAIRSRRLSPARSSRKPPASAVYPQPHHDHRQGLYEGVNIGPEGTVVSSLTCVPTRPAWPRPPCRACALISRKPTGELSARDTQRYPSKKGAQDAHEAIRPTLLDRPPETLENYLDADQMKLYASSGADSSPRR